MADATKKYVSKYYIEVTLEGDGYRMDDIEELRASWRTYSAKEIEDMDKFLVSGSFLLMTRRRGYAYGDVYTWDPERNDLIPHEFGTGKFCLQFKERLKRDGYTVADIEKILDEKRHRVSFEDFEHDLERINPESCGDNILGYAVIMRDGSWYEEFTVDYCSGASEVFHLKTPEENPTGDTVSRENL